MPWRDSALLQLCEHDNDQRERAEHPWRAALAAREKMSSTINESEKNIICV